MAASGYELFDSRATTVSPQSPDTSFHYRVTGTTDPAEVTTWITSNAPLTYGTLVIQDADLSPLGGGEWYVEVKYGPVSRDGMGNPDGTPLAEQGQPTPPPEPQRPPDEELLGPEFSFEVTGEPVHITQSIDVYTSRSSNIDEDPPDIKRAIGLTKDGVEGVDVEVGILRVSETRKFTGITRKYLDTLAGMVGHVCDIDGFWGWNQREVKFDGASGQGHDNKQWTVTYRFSIRKTRHDVEISPDITFPLVLGWDYVDVIYGGEIDQDVLLRVPTAAYVHQIYPEADFSKLGIGR